VVVSIVYRGRVQFILPFFHSRREVLIAVFWIETDSPNNDPSNALLTRKSYATLIRFS